MAGLVLTAGVDLPAVTAPRLAADLAADFAAGLGFAAALRATGFLAGAFSGLVLFNWAVLRHIAGHVPLGDRSLSKLGPRGPSYKGHRMTAS